MAVSTQIRNGFSKTVTEELNSRVEWTETGDTQWLYKKRAWSRVTFTGLNQSVAFEQNPEQMVIESDGLTEGYVGGLVTRMDGRDAPRPILESVTLKNTGRGDIFNAGLYEAEFSYKVFSLADLDRVEMAFMVPTNIVRIEFGWHPYSNNQTADYIEGAIAGFSFSANLDGSFSCNGKIIGGAANTPFKITEAVKSKKDNSDDSEEEEEVGIFLDIRKQVDKALSLTRKPSGKISNNKFVPFDGNIKSQGEYAVANIEIDETAKETSGDSLVRAYITLDGLIEYFNTNFMKTANDYKKSTNYKYVINGTMVKDKLIKSSDPSNFLLRGEQGFYSDNMKLNVDYNGDSVGGIFISTDILTDIEATMKDEEVRNGNESVGNMTLNNFLSTLFTKLKQSTGGAVDLRLYQTDPNNREVEPVIDIINASKDILPPTNPNEYVFSTISPKSIIKSMNLSSNLDSDTLLMARSSVSSDTPYPAIEQFFKNYGLKVLPRTTDSDDGSTEGKPEKQKSLKETLEENWVEFGNAYTDEKVGSNSSTLRNYFNSLSKGKGASGLVRYAIDLSIDIDGILGVQVLDSFKIDRLPNSMRASNIHFVVTEVEHSIGDGKWITKLNGAMHISI